VVTYLDDTGKCKICSNREATVYLSMVWKDL
jgi:hypothetical protein